MPSFSSIVIFVFSLLPVFGFVQMMTMMTVLNDAKVVVIIYLLTKMTNLNQLSDMIFFVFVNVAVMTDSGLTFFSTWSPRRNPTRMPDSIHPPNPSIASSSLQLIK